LKLKYEEREKNDKDREIQIMRSKEYEAKLESFKNKQKVELASFQKQYMKEIAKKQQEIEKLMEVHIEKKKLESKLKWVNEQLQSTGVRINNIR
jgi:hypothetical protein